MVAACQHPNILMLYGIVAEMPHYAHIVEDMPKGTLYETLRAEGQALDWELRWIMVIEIGKALSYLHENNIIHRDLSSYTVFLTLDYHPKVFDFGFYTYDIMAVLAPPTREALSGGVHLKHLNIYIKSKAQMISIVMEWCYGKLLRQYRLMPMSKTNKAFFGNKRSKRGSSYRLPQKLRKIILATWQDPTASNGRK